MTHYVGWETATSLLLAYETLALEHKNTLRRVKGTEDGAPEPHPHFSFMHGFALLILNASIIEGTVRTILSEQVKVDLDAAVERGKKAGRIEHDSPTRLLAKFLVDLENSGGWDNLVKASGVAYFGERLDHSVPADTREGIQVLFVLRNVLAHGTTLIQPKIKMPDDMKDEYPFNWQAKLGGVAAYLEKHFKRGDVFANLSHPDVYEHFMKVTKQFVIEIEKKFTPLPERAAKTVDMIKRYSFGYINYTR